MVSNESVPERQGNSKAQFNSHVTGPEAAVMAAVQRSKELKEERSQKLLLGRISHNLLFGCAEVRKAQYIKKYGHQKQTGRKHKAKGKKTGCVTLSFY